MRITWDEQQNRFHAELTPGDKWREDMECVKTAGFRTDGPPSWQWHTQKASVLNKLRAHKPSSGLTLTELALQHYQTINKKEEDKTALKKQFLEASKKAKKESKDPEISGLVELIIPEGKMWISAEDLPVLETKSKWSFTPPTPPEERCMVCEDPIYFYEKENICLFCEIELDKKTEVC